MRTFHFLAPYLRRYVPWIALSLTSIAVFALASALMLGLIPQVFAQVMPIDQFADDDLGMARDFLRSDEEQNEQVAPLEEAEQAEEAAEAENEEPGGLTRLLPFGGELDQFRKRSHERLGELYLAAQARLGVSDSNRLWRPQYFAPIMFVLVFTFRSLASFLGGYTFQRIGFGVTTDIRNDLYEFLLAQSIAFHSENPSGKLFSRVINDVSRMQNAFSTRLVDLFQQTVMLVFCLAALFVIHAQLAFVCLVAMPLIVYPVVRFGRGMFKTSHHSQERMEDLAELLTEGVRGNRVVKAFGMEKFESDKFRKATSRHLAVNLRAQMLASASSPVIETLAAIGACVLLVSAGNMIRAGELTPAIFMAFLTTLFMLYDPIRKLNKVNLIVQEALAASERVADLLSKPITVPDDPKHPGLERIENDIVFDGVSFSYAEDKPVLHAFDLNVKAGEIVALVGSSGAGKSTVVNLLPRFFDPDEGRLLIDGVDVRDLPLANLRSLIGIVTQDTMLFNDTVRNNIAYGRADLPLERVREAAAAAYADEFIAQMEHGYDTVIGESGHQLSGGQRQRLAIARALLKNAPILILDEATSHLDSESELLVQRAVYNLMEGRTALVIAHRLSTVAKADRILVMQNGEIIEEGTHETLLARAGAYKNLYDLQFRS